MQGGPRIKHLDDVPWVVVSKYKLADGTIAEVREKWIEQSPRYVAFYNEWDPGALSPPHGHTGDHSVLILEGEIRNGDLVCRAGSHIMLEWGDLFGPWVAGPEGCKLYGVVAGMANAFVDKKRWQAFLDEIGAEEVAVPMPDIPVWFPVDSILVNPTEGP